MNRTLENRMAYSMTISPPYRLSSPIFLYNEDIPKIKRWLRKFSRHYVIYSEFDNESRLHYHLSVWIHDITKYHKTKYLLAGKLGYIKTKLLKTSFDLLRWHLYCIKDQPEMKKSFPRVEYRKVIRRSTAPRANSKQKTIYDYFQ